MQKQGLFLITESVYNRFKELKRKSRDFKYASLSVRVQLSNTSLNQL